MRQLAPTVTLTLLVIYAVTAKKSFNFERLFRDLSFAKFLVSEFNYTQFLRDADYSALKYVPFQDSSNDTFFRVGLFEFSHTILGFDPITKYSDYTRANSKTTQRFGWKSNSAN